MKRFHDRDTAFHAWATTATPIGIAEVVKGAQIRSWSHVFTVETIWLRRLYVLFFIELGSRRVRVAGCTPNPNAPWVIQQARQLSWTLAERSEPIRFLIRDRDNKFTDRFDDVFRSDGIEIVRTPFRAPQANGVAERFVRTALSFAKTAPRFTARHSGQGCDAGVVYIGSR